MALEYECAPCRSGHTSGRLTGVRDSFTYNLLIEKILILILLMRRKKKKKIRAIELLIGGVTLRSLSGKWVTRLKKTTHTSYVKIWFFFCFVLEVEEEEKKWKSRTRRRYASERELQRIMEIGTRRVPAREISGMLGDEIIVLCF